jgi:hypothetical protein
MDLLPDDTIWYIKKYLYDCEDLLNLKITCKSFDRLITSFSLGKLMLYGKFLNYRSTEMCANVDCYDETWDIYEDVYYFGSRRYMHCHQWSLNKTIITINDKQYYIHTPYCTECFIKYVLIGDKKDVNHNLIMDEVNIEY